MQNWAIFFGLALIGLAVVGAMGDQNPAAVVADGTEVKSKASVTAWIPSFFGVPLVVCGLLVIFKPAWRKHAMHAAVGIAGLGAVLAGSRALMSMGKLISNDPTVNRRAAIFVILMALICVVYVVLSVRSFIQARRSSTTPAST